MLVRGSFVGVFAGWSGSINMMGWMYCSGIYILIKQLDSCLCKMTAIFISLALKAHRNYIFAKCQRLTL